MNTYNTAWTKLSEIMSSMDTSQLHIRARIAQAYFAKGTDKEPRILQEIVDRKGGTHKEAQEVAREIIKEIRNEE